MSMNCASVPVTLEGATTHDAMRILFDHHFTVEVAQSPELVDEVQALRYQVYCCERGFEDANSFPDGKEQDPYDYRSIHALVRHRLTGECMGSVRLVMADKQDPTAQFPVETHCGEGIPDSANVILDNMPRIRVAEISRLAVSRSLRQRISMTRANREMADDPLAEHHILPHIAVGLFAAVTRIAAEQGITHWFAVMEPTFLRLLKRYGIQFPHVGPVVHYHGRRRPAFTGIRRLLDGIHATRPDVWNLMTQSGTVLPARPQLTTRQPAPVTEDHSRPRIVTPKQIIAV